MRTIANGYAIGNCYHCHEQHASYQGAEPAPIGGAPDAYLGFSSEENLCLGCHDTGGAVGVATDDIDADIDKVYGHGTGPTNTLTMFESGRHRANETSVTGVTNAAHVECTDCHNPHRARTDASGKHSQGSNLIESPGPLEGVDGADFSAYPSGGANWSAVLPAFTATSTKVALATATKEYQICFKCHSSHNGSIMAGWDDNPGNAQEWTDVALEFNTNNGSYHPVVGTTDPGDRVSGLTGGWSVGQTMYCSDCHDIDSTSTTVGPHGSAIKWMLTGTNKAWPYTTATGANGNGTNVTTNFRTYNNRNTSSGTDNGLFCLNCHAVGAGVHSADSGHQSIACVNCHIRVPHGGKLARLITTDSPNLPARYHPDGQGGGFSGGRVSGYTDYGTSKSDCRQSGCGEHSSGLGLTYW